jgi:DNA invertase Pin-like site-specific DNA recombinase
VHELKSKGVTLRAREQPVDTSTAAGKVFDVLGVFAEFETILRRRRQIEGTVAVKEQGSYKHRKPRTGPEEVRLLQLGEMLSPSTIAKLLGIARSSVYRFLREADEASAPENRNVEEADQRRAVLSRPP